MAGRKSYVITPADYPLARRYIDHAMHRGEIGTANGYMTYRQACTAEALQAWCDDYLPAAAWPKLKNAVSPPESAPETTRRCVRRSESISTTSPICA